jgi:hypothetical protein
VAAEKGMKVSPKAMAQADAVEEDADTSLVING